MTVVECLKNRNRVYHFFLNTLSHLFLFVCIGFHLQVLCMLKVVSDEGTNLIILVFVGPFYLTVLCLEQDFAHYKSGVYKHVTGDALGGHAVKLIGWGTSEDGEDYWVG